MTNDWGAMSVSFWLALLIGFGLVALGINGLIQPKAAAQSFGLPLHSPSDGYVVRVKADRDLVTGLAVMIFALLRMKETLGIYLAVGSLMPLFDGILVLAGGGRVRDCWQHFITVAFLLLVAAILFRN
jgi:Domain of unknown function (DUF4267)